MYTVHYRTTENIDSMASYKQCTYNNNLPVVNDQLCCSSHRILTGDPEHQNTCQSKISEKE